MHVTAFQTTRTDLDAIMENGSDKPTMLLISKTWCGACKQLKTAFNAANAESKEVEGLAQKFNMVSIQFSLGFVCACVDFFTAFSETSILCS